VEKIQKEFKTDVLGLGLTLKQRHPSVWRLYEGKWDEVFPEVEVEVAVGSRIVSTGVLSRPGRMRE
jgi:spore germination protein KC